MEGPTLGKLIYLTEVPPEVPGGMFSDVPDTFDVKLAAKLLDVSADTVRSEIAKGKLRRFKVGTAVRITKQALIDYVLAQEGEGL